MNPPSVTATTAAAPTQASNIQESGYPGTPPLSPDGSGMGREPLIAVPAAGGGDAVRPGVSRPTQELPRISVDPEMGWTVFYGKKLTVAHSERYHHGLLFLDPCGAKDPVYLNHQEIEMFVYRCSQMLHYKSRVALEQFPDDTVLWSFALREPPSYDGKLVLSLQKFHNNSYMWLKFLVARSGNFFAGTKAMVRLEEEDLTRLLQFLSQTFNLKTYDPRVVQDAAH